MTDQQWNEPWPNLTRVCGKCKGSCIDIIATGRCMYCNGTGRLPVRCEPAAGMVVEHDGCWGTVTMYFPGNADGPAIEIMWREGMYDTELLEDCTPILPPPSTEYKPWDALYPHTLLDLECGYIEWPEGAPMPIWRPFTDEIDRDGFQVRTDTRHGKLVRDMQKYGIILAWLAQEEWGNG